MPEAVAGKAPIPNVATVSAVVATLAAMTLWTWLRKGSAKATSASMSPAPSGAQTEKSRASTSQLKQSKERSQNVNDTKAQAGHDQDQTPQQRALAQAYQQAQMLSAREEWRMQKQHEQSGTGNRKSRPVPITLVTGDLGSGKTTLIRRVIESVRDFSLGVVVNDFAPLNIDKEAIEEQAQLVRQAPGAAVSPQVVELSNGCVCCSLSSGLADAVRAMVATNREAGIDYILVETSGLTNPAAIVRVIEQEIQGSVRLDAVVLVTDADRWPQTLATTELTLADIILLNKTDIFPSESAREDAQNQLQQAAGKARVVPCSFGEIPLEQVLDVVRVEPEREAFGRMVTGKHARERLGTYTIPENGGNLTVRLPPPTNAKHASKQVNRWSSIVFRQKSAISLVSLQRYLLDDAACIEKLARLKGTATFIEAPEQDFDFQISGAARISLVPRSTIRVTSARCELAAVVQGDKQDADNLHDLLLKACDLDLTSTADKDSQSTDDLATILKQDANWIIVDESPHLLRLRLVGTRSYAVGPDDMIRKFAIDLNAANLTFVKAINASGLRVASLPFYYMNEASDAEKTVGLLLTNFNQGDLAPQDWQRVLQAIDTATQTAFKVDFVNVKHCRCD